MTEPTPKSTPTPTPTSGPSPEAVAELQKEVESLTRVLTELAERPLTTAAEPWPRDLNSQPADASWGSDPEDLRGG